MAASSNSPPVQCRRDLSGQTVLVIGGSSGIGLETARLARARGADIILTARNPDRVYRAGLELGASIAAFDATDFGRLRRFFDALPAPIDHLLITGPGPYHAPLAEFDPVAARRDVDAHLLLALQVAGHAASKVRPAGTLLFLGGACGRRAAVGVAFTAAVTAALSAVTRDLALEVAPIRVNLIAAGCAGTLPAGTRPAGRVVGPAGIAALAVHLMTSTAVTGATFDIDGGQRLVEG
ncbi:MAG: Carbonyl reductase family er 4 [Actinomycetia bacterium]|nr:Carbonyl reductase family er 4 [Actinomycetes bacterium]